MTPEEAAPGLARRFGWRLAAAFGLTGALALVGLSLMRSTAAAEEVIARAEPRWLLAGTAAWLTAVALQGLRWRALIPGPRVGMVDAMLWHVAASPLHFGVPGPFAEAAAAAMAKARAGTPFAAAFAASISGRLLGLGLFGALVLGLWPLVAPPDTVATGLASAATLALAGAGFAAFTLAVLPRRVVAAAIWAAARLLKPVTAAKVAARLRSTGETLASVTQLGVLRWSEALGMSLSGLAFQILAVGYSLRAIGAEPALTLTAWLHGVVSVSALVGVVMPGGEAASDAAFISAFSAIGDVSVATAAVGDAAARTMRLGAIVCALPFTIWLVRTVGVGGSAR